MIKPYTSELRTKDADIARAMGLTIARAGGDGDYYENETGLWFCFDESPDGYYWRAKLLDWLAADDARWKAFTDTLAWIGGLDCGGDDIEGMLRFYMLATPAQVAEAAWREVMV